MLPMWNPIARKSPLFDHVTRHICDSDTAVPLPPPVVPSQIRRHLAPRARNGDNLTCWDQCFLGALRARRIFFASNV